MKTANATANSPFNKWQTYVFVGDDAVSAALQQATDENGELRYVNKYGELKPRSEVEDLLKKGTIDEEEYMRKKILTKYVV